MQIFIPLQDCQQGLPAFQVSPHIWPPDYQALFLPGRDLNFLHNNEESKLFYQ